ncbi:hypothetical protein [Undibacterium rugosum]|uniref:Uncharacterized protein n=1 Tax=Undibacterium rugosum TaxID=2762291 RepID=A0A923L027_9BURK|nr:hypothetical protein [Undibacterium rugosum]MBC3937040.1 hypothetical protein [Undibacterium rugosum]MBR7780274.1 hypothetical protein [Undibacterium rugosum]
MNTAYTRFARWSDRNAWQAIFVALCEDADFEEAYLTAPLCERTIMLPVQLKKGEQAFGRSAAVSAPKSTFA